MKRVATAAILIPPILLVIFRGPDPILYAVVATVACLCFHEFRGIAAAHGARVPGPAGYVAGLLLLIIPGSAVLATLVFAALLGLTLAMRSDNLKESLPAAGAFLLGVTYIFGAWRFAPALRAISAHWLLFALVINWIGDTGAYFTGRFLGRHKMAPRISPAKTWEGCAGSVLSSLLFGVLYVQWALPAVPLGISVGLSLAGNIAGQIGDLLESALKRGAGLKDSGSLLPGHGGWLDRVDSSLFALPVVHQLLLFWQQAQR